MDIQQVNAIKYSKLIIDRHTATTTPIDKKGSVEKCMQ